MAKVDRRIAKSQVAIKNAVTELMSEKSFVFRILRTEQMLIEEPFIFITRINMTFWIR
jgi:hypothetical protein